MTHEEIIARWKEEEVLWKEREGELLAEIAALKEPLACGHPKACWVVSLDRPDPRPPAPPLNRCTACEHERLAVAAALREAAIDANFADNCAQEIKRRIEARISDADQKALAAHDAERDQQWIEAFGAQDLEPRVTPTSLAKWVYLDVQQQLDGLEHEKVEARDRALEEFKAALNEATQQRGELGFHFIDEYLPGGIFHADTLKRLAANRAKVKT